MNDEIQSARDDLAFIRALSERTGQGSIAGGSVFLAGGLLYGLQCLYHWGQLKGWVNLPEPVNLAVAVGTTVVFMAVLIAVLWRDRKRRQTGMASRALNAMFGGIGLANLAMVAVFGVNAAAEGDFRIWLFYPAVIFALQGAAWYASSVIRQRAWQAVVGIGWLAVAVVLGLSRNSLDVYLFTTAAALFLLMALPGWVLIRLARKEAQA